MLRPPSLRVRRARRREATVGRLRMGMCLWQVTLEWRRPFGSTTQIESRNRLRRSRLPMHTLQPGPEKALPVLRMLLRKSEVLLASLLTWRLRSVN